MPLLDDDCQEDRREDGWRLYQATRPNTAMEDDILYEKARGTCCSSVSTVSGYRLQSGTRLEFEDDQTYITTVSTSSKLNWTGL
jgi:hypothetical protein